MSNGSVYIDLVIFKLFKVTLFAPLEYEDKMSIMCYVNCNLLEDS